MAFIVPLALVGLGLVVDKSTNPSKSSAKEYTKKLKIATADSRKVDTSAYNIVDGPIYQPISPDVYVMDNSRINEELTAVEDSAEAKLIGNAQRAASDPVVKQLLDIVRQFIKDKNLVIYGGTALNALMPPQDKFYNYDLEIPDYDFFSPNAQKDAVELANRFYAAGFKDAQARAGVHEGTQKVSANFIQLADISQLSKEILEHMDIVRGEDGLLYVGPMYLRIDLYKQLSESNQPDRWPKVWKRLQLLNRNYPIKCDQSSINAPMLCSMEGKVSDNQLATVAVPFLNMTKLPIVGSYSPAFFANLNYDISTELETLLNSFSCDYLQLASVDVFSNNAQQDAANFIQQFTAQYPSFKLSAVKAPIAEEIFSQRFVVTTSQGQKLIEFMKPDKCLAITNVNGYKFGTIDTILSVLFAKLFIDQNIVTEKTKAKQLCLIQYLADAIKLNVDYNSSQGKWARFSDECYGTDRTLKDIFKQRWEERVERMMAKHRGEKVSGNASMFSYRPNDVELARQGLIDSRFTDYTNDRFGKSSVI